MLRAHNLFYHYSTQKPIFEHLSLELSAGNIYGLLGENGAGKSTLLKLIAGLLSPSKGELHVLGYQPKDRTPQFLQEIYIVPEEFELPKMTLSRFVDLYAPFYPRFQREVFAGYMTEFGLRVEEKTQSLSFGQKKKFLLSFGLATDCKLLILDEPTNGLDIPSKSIFRKLVANAIHEERTFIISTHQVRDMENLIDPIIILAEGEVIFQQALEQIAEKLSFSREQELTDTASIVYKESSFAGHTVVRENSTGIDSKVSLEVLFNAVIGNKGRIQKIFNN